MPSKLRNLFAALLCLILASVGCATPPAYADLGEGSRAGTTLCSPTDGGLVGCADSGARAGGLQPVGDKGKVALWIMVGVALAFVVMIDLVLMPVTYNDPFPCSRAVLHVCY